MANPSKGSSGHTFETATRAQAVVLKTYTTLKNDEIAAITGVSPRQVQAFNQKAKERGFDKDHALKDSHLVNAVDSKPRDPAKGWKVNKDVHVRENSGDKGREFPPDRQEALEERLRQELCLYDSKDRGVSEGEEND